MVNKGLWPLCGPLEVKFWQPSLRTTSDSLKSVISADKSDIVIKQKCTFLARGFCCLSVPRVFLFQVCFKTRKVGIQLTDMFVHLFEQKIDFFQNKS